MNIVGGGTPDTNNATYWNGNIDWYSPTEIGNEIYVSNSLKKISKLGLEKVQQNFYLQIRQSCSLQELALEIWQSF
ncbi:hypothetical protein INT80_14855 [Gallibacterium anatis]|uniref:Uncharacterized protein n=1 Tax=Gallibacterium anatis TaxID=750 RepID=A0A930USG4_9PAST|nr:hypothetical protein [Gallibacterium anatis]